MNDIYILNPGSLSYRDTNNVKHHANFPLLIIRAAWNAGCDFEAEADGYGAGFGTGGDWSGIRDSSPAAIARMFAKAMAFAFPAE